jgi:AraC-like DNA-binding protein
MKTELTYLSFLQREEEKYHHTYDEELLQYEYLRDGDMRAVEESKRLFRSGITGKLSDDPLRDKKYLFVAASTLACRFAIEGGMEAQTAYNISDLYIQKADKCHSIDEVYTLHTDMIADYTKLLKIIHDRSAKDSASSACEKTAVSPPVLRAIDYIYYHLHEKITLSDIASIVGLSPNYLNSLFQKEKGISIQKYISSKRIAAAKNMLLYSEYSETEIAAFLAYSSSSHFIRAFRDSTGMSPRQYVQKNFRTHNRWHDQ